MADPQPSGWGTGNQNASIADLNTQLKFANQNMSLLIQTIAGIFPRAFGAFTLAAAATTAVADTAVTPNSQIVWVPTNAAAGTLLGSADCIYLSARVAGASFTVATASGAGAAGTETFQYFIYNPV